jgi:hypothetical protein
LTADTLPAFSVPDHDVVEEPPSPASRAAAGNRTGGSGSAVLAEEEGERVLVAVSGNCIRLYSVDLPDARTLAGRGLDVPIPPVAEVVLRSGVTAAGVAAVRPRDERKPPQPCIVLLDGSNTVSARALMDLREVFTVPLGLPIDVRLRHARCTSTAELILISEHSEIHRAILPAVTTGATVGRPDTTVAPGSRSHVSSSEDAAHHPKTTRRSKSMFSFGGHKSAAKVDLRKTFDVNQPIVKLDPPYPSGGGGGGGDGGLPSFQGMGGGGGGGRMSAEELERFEREAMFGGGGREEKDAAEQDGIDKARGGAAGAHNAASQARDALILRGEKLSQLAEKTHDMMDHARDFEASAKKLAKQERNKTGWSFF